MTKHEQIEEIIIDMISHGVINAGEPIPSTRKMAKVYGMSVTPITEAYHNLERRGYIKAKSKSRFIVAETKNPDTHNKSQADPGKGTEHIMFPKAELSLYRSLYYALKLDAIIYPFGYADAFICQKNNEEVLSKFYASQKDYYTTLNCDDGYTDHPELLNELSRLMFKFNCHFSPEEILVTGNSVYTSLLIALESCTQAGDYVGIANPGGYHHYMALKTKNLNAVPINSLPGIGISIDSLRQARNQFPRMKCIICTVNVDQPSGTTMSDENKKLLAEFCTESGILIIEDDSTGSANYNNNYRPTPLLSYAPDNTIYISYVNFTDLRPLGLCWMCSRMNLKLLRYFRDVMGILSPRSLQYSVSRLMPENLLERRREFANQLHKSNTDLVSRAIYNEFPVGVQVYSPAGSYGLWVKLPRGCDGQHLFNDALHDGITFFPGAVFSANNEYNDHIYLNCSVLDGHPERLEGIKLLGAHVKKMLSK